MTILESCESVKSLTFDFFVSGVARGGGLRGLEHPLSQKKKKEDIPGIFQK